MPAFYPLKYWSSIPHIAKRSNLTVLNGKATQPCSQLSPFPANTRPAR